MRGARPPAAGYRMRYTIPRLAAADSLAAAFPSAGPAAGAAAGRRGAPAPVPARLVSPDAVGRDLTACLRSDSVTAPRSCLTTEALHSITSLRASGEKRGKLNGRGNIRWHQMHVGLETHPYARHTQRPARCVPSQKPGPFFALSIFFALSNSRQWKTVDARPRRRGLTITYVVERGTPLTSPA